MLFVCYPRCTTCRRAQAWLNEHGVAYTYRDISKHNPGVEELRAWQALSGLPLKRWFNTSGIKYRQLALKDRLAAMPEDEQFALLASDGLLVKRPLLVGGDFVLVGFREEEWQAKLADGR